MGFKRLFSSFLAAVCVAAYGGADLREFSFPLLTSLPNDFNKDLEYVNHITQDSNGYLWIATRKGLFRFDGYEARSFRLRFDSANQQSEIDVHHVTPLDKNKYLLVTNSFIELFDSQSDQIIKRLSIKEIGLAQIRCPPLLVSDTLWTCDNSQLAKININLTDFNLFKSQDLDPRLEDQVLIDIIARDNNRFIVLTTYGLFYKEIGKKHLRELLVFPENFKTSYLNRVVKHHRNDHLWLLFHDKIFAVDINTKKIIDQTNLFADPAIENPRFLQLLDRHGQIFYSTLSGLYWLDASNQASSKKLADRFYLAKPFMSTDGTLWFGSQYNGIQFLSWQTQRFNYMAPISTNEMSDSNMLISLFPHGEYIWQEKLNIYTGTKTITRQHINTKKIETYLTASNEWRVKDRTLLSLVKNQKYLWLTRDNNVDLITKSGEISASYTIPEQYTQGQPTLKQVLQISPGNYLLALSYGAIENILLKLDTKKQSFSRFIDAPSSLPNGAESYSDIETHNLVFHDTSIWLATKNGLYQYNAKGEKQQTISRTSHTNLITDSFTVLRSVGDKLWIGTNNGLFVYHNNKLKNYPYHSELNTLQIVTIIGRDRELWVATDNGLFQLEESGKFKRAFYSSNGLFTNDLSNEFSSDLAGKDNYNNHYITTRTGNLVFNPENLRNKTEDISVYLSSLKVNGATSVTKPSYALNYPSGTAKIEFKLFSSDLINSRLQSFRYKLSPIIKDWVKLEKGQRNIQLLSLPPGHYHFRVQFLNNENNWVASGITHNITIMPPWYATPSAFIAYLLTFLAVMAAIAYPRLKLNNERIQNAKIIKEREGLMRLTNDIGGIVAWTWSIPDNKLVKYGEESRPCCIDLYLNKLTENFSIKAEEHANIRRSLEEFTRGNINRLELIYEIEINGSHYWLQDVGQAINYSDDARPTKIAGSTMDITSVKNTEEKMRELATHDMLTKLPNRSLFQSQLNKICSLASRMDQSVAVIIVGIDDFKHINDFYGYEYGNQLLVKLAKRIDHCLRENDLIDRHGSDEFAIAINGEQITDMVLSVINKLMNACTRPYEIESSKINIRLSAGIALFPDDTDEIDNLIKNADLALAFAKRHDKGGFQFFSDNMNSVVRQRIAMEQKIRKGIENDEFVLFYQPRIDLRDNSICGAECLIRWIDSGGTMIRPDSFIPIAEASGLIEEIDRVVLVKALATLEKWLKQGIDPGKLSINISAYHFSHKEKLLSLIDDSLSKFKVPTKHVELEITEGMLVDKIEECIELLYALNERGITIAVDDFGTGYSSLGYIKRFPVHILKIDRTFIKEMSTDQRDQNIVRSIIALGHNLSLKLVAEGVEEDFHVEFLANEGCDQAQGYFFSKPIEERDFIAYLEKTQAPDTV